MHHAFRRDLAAFAAAVPHTPVEDRATWQALAERWELFAEALHHHHTGEDAGLWPALLERADDEERGDAARPWRPSTRRSTRCSRPAPRVRPAGRAGADEDARAALAVRLVAARESLGRHLAHEETEAIALLQRALHAGRLGGARRGALPRRASPSREAARAGAVGAHEVPDVGAAGPVRHAPAAPHRLIWRLTRRRFARRRGAGRSATPRPPEASEAVAVPLVAQPLRGQRDLATPAHSARASSACRVASSRLPGRRRRHRQEGVHRARGVARAGARSSSRRTARARRRRAAAEVAVAEGERGLRGVAPGEQREPVVGRRGRAGGSA